MDHIKNRPGRDQDKVGALWLIAFVIPITVAVVGSLFTCLLTWERKRRERLQLERQTSHREWHRRNHSLGSVESGGDGPETPVTTAFWHDFEDEVDAPRRGIPEEHPSFAYPLPAPRYTRRLRQRRHMYPQDPPPVYAEGSSPPPYNEQANSDPYFGQTNDPSGREDIDEVPEGYVGTFQNFSRNPVIRTTRSSSINSARERHLRQEPFGGRSHIPVSNADLQPWPLFEDGGHGTVNINVFPGETESYVHVYPRAN